MTAWLIALALAANGPSAKPLPPPHNGPVTPPLDNRYSYIEIHHDGTQDKPAPTLWIGTENGAPPEPAFAIIGVISVPDYVDLLTKRLAVTAPQYKQMVNATAGLKCQDWNGHGWTSLTVRRFENGRLRALCFLSGDASKAYVARLNQIATARSPADFDGFDSLGKFLAIRADDAVNLKRQPWYANWIRLRTDTKTTPEIWFGTDTLTPHPTTAGKVRIVLNDRQYQLMEDVKDSHLICLNEAHSDRSSRLSIEANGKSPATACYGPPACYYVRTLYSLSSPEYAIKGMDAVFSLADRLGCKPQTWADAPNAR